MIYKFVNIFVEQLINVSELSAEEVEKILSSNKFNSLAPVSCKNCGNKKLFKRRIFKIEGDYETGDDDSQNAVRYFMKHNYNLGYIFFKINNNENYVDAAICSKCNSNNVIYDIELNDELFDELAKHFNIPKDLIKNEMRKIHERLS